MFTVYPQPAATNRMVLKSNTAGQALLPSMGSAVTATTDSVNNSFGSWVQVTASTSVEYYVTGVMAYCTVGTTAGISAPLYVDIGVGAAGSEVSLSTVPIGSSIGVFGNTSPSFLPGGHELLDAPARVAPASRLAIRVALSNPNAVTRSCTVYLLVVPYTAAEGN